MSMSYIGSKISLISKAEIRYEGTLFSVDPKEATITLSKVRTFGTENRATDHPMPARNEVFEFIIFKATDIKDIIVCETPQNKYCGLPFDPAIVSVSKGGAPPNLQQPVLSSDLSTNAAGVPATFPSALSSRSVSPIGVQKKTAVGGTSGTTYDVTSPPPPLSSVAPQNRAPGAGRRESSLAHNCATIGTGGMSGVFRSSGAPTATHGYFGAEAPPRRRDEDVESVDEARSRGHYNTRDPQGNVYRQRDTYQRGSNISGGFQNRTSSGVRGYVAAVTSSLPQHDRYVGGPRGSFDHQVRRSTGGAFNARGHVARGTGARIAHHPHHTNKRFDSDYDFEKANEKFRETLNELKDGVAKTKLEDGKENRDTNANETHPEAVQKKEAEGDVPESGDNTETADAPLKVKQSYNRAKSFFDNISCEALENLEGTNNARPNWRRERELNQETFGQIGLRSFQYRRGATQRGGGTAGNFGGRRGGGYNTADQRNFSRYR